MLGPFPDDISLIKGGVQASVYGLAKALQGKECINSVTGISTPIKDNLDSKVTTKALDGIEVTYLNAPLKFLISSVMHLPIIFRKIKTLSQPLVHIHGTGLLETMLCITLRFKRVPYVWTLHGILEKETLQYLHDKFSLGNLLRYVLYTGLERLMLHITPTVIVDTQYVKEAIRRKDVVVIPQGILLDEYSAMASAPRTEKLIACIGVIDPRKGHVQTIEAFALLHKRMPDARLIIAGSLTVPSYLEEMKQRIADLAMQDFITLEIQQPRSIILGILARAQVFTLHSREESQGIALCEALACGLPIVATRVGGIPYVVDDKKNGLLVAYGDIKATAEALESLLTNDALRQEMAQQARISGASFGWDSIADKIVELYSKASLLEC